MALAPKTVLTYPIDGANRDFPIPFEYLARKFVQVTLIGVDRKLLTLNIDYRFTQRTVITLTKSWGPSDGYTSIELRRFTSATERLVDFSDGSILRAYDLNTAAIQSLHIAEEGRDIATDTIGVDNGGNLDARGRRIVNLADGINSGDAVTIGQQDRWADSAKNSATRSEASAVDSGKHAQAARDARDAAVLAKIASADSAESARIEVELATIQRDRALRVAHTEPTLPFIPGVELRANKVLGFNDLGNPVAFVPATGSGTELALDLASVSATKGSALVQHGEVSVKEALDSIKGTQAKLTGAVFRPEDFGAVGDGITDDRAAYQACLNAMPEYSTLVHAKNAKYLLKDGVGISKRGTHIDGRQGRIIYPKTSAGFYHCLRVDAPEVFLETVRIFGPGGDAVRGDTGFGVSWGPKATDGLMIGCYFKDIASASVWATQTNGLRMLACVSINPLADGFHLSDGCRKFALIGNTSVGAHDDSFAIVGDTVGDGLVPSYGVVANNVVDGSVDGHGVVLIACAGIAVIGNRLHGTGGAAIGSYFWLVHGVPAPEDWANDILISGNHITAPGLRGTNLSSQCAISLGANVRTFVLNNSLQGSNVTTHGEPCVIQVVNCSDGVIMGNVIADCAGFGVVARADAGRVDNVKILNNHFKNIANFPVAILTPAQKRSFTVGNTFEDCAYAAGVTATVYVRGAGANRVVISNNHNLTSSTAPTTSGCTNVVAEGNSPAYVYSWTPVVQAAGGAWTSHTATGSYTRQGGLTFLSLRVIITGAGNGSGCLVTLPAALKQGGVMITGRESKNSGKGIGGSPNTLTTIALFFSDGGNVSAQDNILGVNMVYQHE